MGLRCRGAPAAARRGGAARCPRARDLRRRLRARAAPGLCPDRFHQRRRAGTPPDPGAAPARLPVQPPHRPARAAAPPVRALDPRRGGDPHGLVPLLAPSLRPRSPRSAAAPLVARAAGRAAGGGDRAGACPVAGRRAAAGARAPQRRWARHGVLLVGMVAREDGARVPLADGRGGHRRPARLPQALRPHRTGAAGGRGRTPARPAGAPGLGMPHGARPPGSRDAGRDRHLLAGGPRRRRPDLVRGGP